MFELVADDFRRIVRYEAPRIVLHGVRDITTLSEEDPVAHAVRRLGLLTWCEGHGSSLTRKQSQNGWECVREFPHLTTHEEILSATKDLNPWQQVRISFASCSLPIRGVLTRIQAGFVVRDALGNRIKYLSPQYMAFFFAMGWQNKGTSGHDTPPPHTARLT